MSDERKPPATARSFLFVPGDRPERLGKALGSGANAVIVDLEDAVAADAKASARDAISHAWHALGAEAHARLLVRINAVGSPWHEADLAAVRALHGLGGIVLPKADSVTSAEAVAQAAGTPVVPLIETALGYDAIDFVARAHGVLRLAFGHLDFQADTGMSCEADERELDAVRLQFVLASRRAGLPAPVDGITPQLDDAARLAADTARSRRFGFGGKLCIHPKQVAAVNEGLAATPAQRAWAQRVLDAAAQLGSGALRLDGEMIDAPVLQRARRFLAQ
ncbi:MAG TPA: CoA ester lyase [Ramlibacter sp.]|nr:CoA ester lyase [Ramlibacter sp.]